MLPRMGEMRMTSRLPRRLLLPLLGALLWLGCENLKPREDSAARGATAASNAPMAAPPPTSRSAQAMASANATAASPVASDDAPELDDPAGAGDDDDGPNSAGVNLFADATPIPKAYAGKLPQPAVVFSMQIKEAWVILGVVQSQNAEHGDYYVYRRGQVEAAQPAKDGMVAINRKHHVPFERIDFSIVARIGADATKRANLEGSRVKSVDLYLGGWRVRLRGPRADAKVDYSLDGQFQRMKKN